MFAFHVEPILRGMVEFAMEIDGIEQLHDQDAMNLVKVLKNLKRISTHIKVTNTLANRSK